MRSTDFPFAVTPQRLQRGGRPDYSAPSAALAAVRADDDQQFGGISARDTSVRDQIKDKLAVRFGRRNAEQMMQVLDFTPLAGAFVGNEAALAVRGGKRGEAAANVALAALPIPGAAKKGIKAAAKGAKSLAVKPRGITAYHGSPHSFDRFDMSKIGTGEGAQAYGHGLYFAENEDVAQTYRDALTKGAMDSTELKKIGLSPNDRAHAMTFARTTNNLFPEVAARDFANYSGKELTPDLIEAFRKTMDVPKGSMYQVRIDADPADFLDYDAPLIGQPQRVREGVARAMSRGDDLLSDLFGDLSDPNAMQLAGLFPKSSGAQVYNTITASDRAAATQALREAGIPGIKYLDQGSRGAGDGTRNYVVFDDKLISILKKYGWAPGMAIPAAAMAEYEAEQELARGGFAVKKGR